MTSLCCAAKKDEEEEEEESEDVADAKDGPCDAGSYYPCVKFGMIGIPCLRENRSKVGHLVWALATLALLLSIVFYVGAFAFNDLLALLPWVTIESPTGVSHAGVRWVCWDLPGNATCPDPCWSCTPWSEFDCSMSPSVRGCERCKTVSIGLYFSMAVAIYTFYSFYSSANLRFRGADSNWNKVMICNTALVGGVNFVVTVLSYWESCVESAKAPDTTATPGVSLVCISVAAILKILVGLLHLGLPVDKVKLATEE